jgi:hypothetical protein
MFSQSKQKFILIHKGGVTGLFAAYLAIGIA